MLCKVAVFLFVLCAAQANPNQDQNFNGNNGASDQLLFKKLERNQSTISSYSNDQKKKCDCALEEAKHFKNKFKYCTDAMIKTTNIKKGCATNIALTKDIRKCIEDSHVFFGQMINAIETNDCTIATERFDQCSKRYKECQKLMEYLEPGIIQAITEEVTPCLEDFFGALGTFFNKLETCGTQQ